MAKKRKRKRKVQQAAPQTAPPHARQERKEAARRERERIVRAGRRRRTGRLALRWGAVAVVVAAISGFVGYRFVQDRQLLERAGEAATELGCGEVQSPPSEGRGHIVDPGSPEPEYATTPAASGPHSPSALPPEVSVYDRPVPEALAVHNLEHAYVFLYYRSEGPQALDDEVREALTELARSENKVILAPYPDLPEGTSLALVAWTKLQECPGGGEADQAVLVAKAFIQQFRGTSNAPEPSAA